MAFPRLTNPTRKGNGIFEGRGGGGLGGSKRGKGWVSFSTFCVFVFCSLLLIVFLFVCFFFVCMVVCLFFSGAPGKISKLLKTPNLLSKRRVFFLLTAVSKQELLHLRFHC